MKINIIIPFTCLTGGIRVIFLYGNYLVSKGHDVEFYVPMIAYKFDMGIAKRIKFTLGNTLKRRNKVKWFKCEFKINLVPKIKDKYIRNANITIATAWPTAYDVENLIQSKGKKVYFIQGYEIWSGKKEDVDNSYKLPLKRIVITQNLKNIIYEEFGVESSVIYNGLNEDEFIQGSKRENEVDTILMLYNKNIHKGTEDGIKVLENLSSRHNLRIILFGYKKDRNISNKFEFYENPDRKMLMDLYRKSDIYICPSKQEAWGLPVMEAMANKCAIVGNNVGCIKEICTNNKNAMVIKNFDINEMEFKVEELLKNKYKMREIQQNGYELALKFKWKKSFEKFERYLWELLLK